MYLAWNAFHTYVSVQLFSQYNGLWPLHNTAVFTSIAHTLVYCHGEDIVLNGTPLSGIIKHKHIWAPTSCALPYPSCKALCDQSSKHSSATMDAWTFHHRFHVMHTYSRCCCKLPSALQLGPAIYSMHIYQIWCNQHLEGTMHNAHCNSSVGVTRHKPHLEHLWKTLGEAENALCFWQLSETEPTLVCTVYISEP